VTTTDIDAMARTVWGEARNQSYLGQVSVAYVIKNRARNRMSSIYNICHAPFQFSCWNKDDPNLPKVLAISLDNSPSFIEAYGISCLVIVGSIDDPTKGADHYHTINRPPNVKVWPPVWSKDMNQTITIGDHVFYRSV
jgi:N-acetylmuramoyl-L-alanine amidase